MKQDCKTILPLVSELVDGALDADTTWKVRMHLSVCPHCAAMAKDFEAAAQLVKGLPRRELSENFDAALAARIAAIGPIPEKPRGLRGFFSTRPPTARVRQARAPLAVALAGLAAIGFLSIHIANQPSRLQAARPPAVSDSALLATCLRQHHSYVASDPLADPSAQTLASQVDASFDAGASPATNPSAPERM